MLTPGAARSGFDFVENTGIAAAGEAGIGGEAGIIGTDRDSGAGGGRGW